MSTTQNNEKTAYAVVVVFSNWSLRQICSFMEDELLAQTDQLGLMRIDRVKGKETNRTLMLIDRGLLELAEQKGYTQHQRGLDFKMVEYELRDHNRPKEGYTRNFFIPLPAEVLASDAQAQLENMFEICHRFGMFKKNQPRVNIPLESRESEKHRGRCFVTFSRDTNDDEVALARVLLHDTRLYTNETEYELMRCFWAKERSPKSSPVKKSAKTKGKKPQKKKAPPKKGLVKKPESAVQKEQKPKEPVIVPALEPGENKWDKPLVGLTPLPPVSVQPNDQPEVSESDKTDQPEQADQPEEKAVTE